MTGTFDDIWVNDESVEPLASLLSEQVANPTPMPATCPVCSTTSAVHIHLHRFSGVIGGGWIWCSHCRRYDHDRRPIPDRWANNPGVELDLLVSPPVPLDDRSDVIDGHWNMTMVRGTPHG